MSELLEDGIGLMVLGMGFVFLFLVVLIFVTGYMSRFLNKYFPEVQSVAELKVAPQVVNQASIEGQMAEAITAAVHHHRNKNIN